MSRQTTRLLAALGLAAAVAGGWFGYRAFQTPPADAALFEDMTSASGIDFRYRNGEEADLYTILESLGGGVALLDYDQDGLLDIFVAGGGWFDARKQIKGYPNRLFRNEGKWRFRDVTAEGGLPTEGVFYSHGGAAGDYNNDGWPDLLVTGYGRMALYENRQGKFVDVTAAAGLRDQRPLHWSTSAAWADLQGKGRLDLFVCHYVDWSFANDPLCAGFQPGKTRDVCSPANFKPLLPALYLNQGDGTFKEAGPQAGLIPGNGLGVVAFDADEDSRIDLFVANDQSGNHLYLNKGNGVFEEAGVQRGAAYSQLGNRDGSMGVAAADYDHTGRLALFITNFAHEEHSLLRNAGGGHFRHAGKTAGVSAVGTLHVGFGVGFLDFDLDGSEDLFFTNGHVLRFPAPPITTKQRPVLLRNTYRSSDQTGPVRFEIITDRGGPYFRADHMGRGVAFGDLDNDGGIDLVISHINEPLTLLRNVAPKHGNWLGLVLDSKISRDPIGAQLTLEVGGRKLTRHILGGGSYLSSSDRRVVFGLGAASAVDRLTVRWPNGFVQTWLGSDLTLGRYNTLTQNSSETR